LSIFWQYALKSLAGEFTGLQLISYLFVGIKSIDPNQEVGIDLAREYSMALSLFEEHGDAGRSFKI